MPSFSFKAVALKTLPLKALPFKALPFKALPLLFALVVDAGAVRVPATRAAQQTKPDGFTRDFGVEPGELGPTGRNPYFILEPGYRLVLEHEREKLVITVLDSVVRIDGVDTRVVEERETDGDQLVEVSRNFFAISRRTNSVFYFGEAVDIYKHGVVASHDGAWRAGVNGARFGLAMPGQPLLGARYYQEVAPGSAMDRAEVSSLSNTLATPAGNFASLLRIEETTPLEPGNHEYKLYAAGVGLVRDDALVLTHRSGATQRTR